MGESKGKSRAEGTNGREVKRQRVSRACNRCRLARQKCDGGRPTCSSCASANIECTYAPGSKRRGLQSGYIRTIELALSWCVFNVPGCEDSMKTLLRTENGRQLLSNGEGEAATKLQQRWRQTAVCKGIDRLLSGSGPEEEDEDEERPLSSEPAMLDVDFDGGRLDFPGSALFHDDNLAQNNDRPASLSVESTPKLILPNNFAQLVDVYFAYTHCWLPIVSKESILKLCYTYPKDGLNIDSYTPGNGAYAELWSILAVASFQIQYVCGSNDGMMLANQMMSSAQDLVPKDSGLFEKGHASSLLLLTLLKIGTDDLPSAWVIVGFAIRIVLLLRKNPEPINSPTTTQDRQEVLNPLLSACFVLETFLSVQLNTIPHLRLQDMPVGLLNEEGLDEWQPWTACPDFVSGDTEAPIKRSSPMLSHSVFNQLVRLCFVLSESITPSSIPSSPYAANSDNALLDWIRQMPAKIRGLYSISENEPTPHRLNLLLAYLVAKAICNPPNRHVAIDKALSVFDIYAQTLGHAVIPPIFMLFASILQRDEQGDSLRRHRLDDIKSQVRMVWDDASSSPLSNLHQKPSTQSSANHILHTASSSLHGNIHPNAKFQLATGSMEDFDSFPNPQTQFLDMPSATPQPIYDDHPLETAIEPPNSNSLMDLDALFDDLTSFDGGEQQNTRPVFMQNLGFAANANLTDLMAGGFGWTYNQ